MKFLIPHAIAGMLAAGAVSFAMAQTDPGSNAATAVSFVSEPIASASRADGPDADRLNAIVQALNADESLKNSKITVVPDENGGVTLTGATMTEGQAKHAAEIAAAQAGDGKVVNAIQPDRVTYRTWAVIG